MKVAAAIKNLQFELKARNLNATVENDTCSRYVNLQLVAPAGQRWVDGDCRCMQCHTAAGPQEWLDDAVTDTIERIGYGLRKAEPNELEDDE